MRQYQEHAMHVKYGLEDLMHDCPLCDNFLDSDLRVFRHMIPRTEENAPDG